jgi:hypothetical protein
MQTKTKKGKEKTGITPTADFDAIKTMREIRERLSHEIMNMSYEEERLYLDKLLANGLSGQK